MVPVTVRVDSAPRSHVLHAPLAACVHVTPAPSRKAVLVVGPVFGSGSRLAFDPYTMVLASFRLGGVGPRVNAAGDLTCSPPLGHATLWRTACCAYCGLSCSALFKPA